MPPKGTVQKAKDDAGGAATNEGAKSPISNGNRASVETSSKKRKSEKQKSEQPAKASRRSARGASPQKINSVKLINFLLSSDCIAVCRPKDEKEDIGRRGDNIRTYSTSTFTPFEELTCALILSRPIGHMLGQRSIRTLFNDPHNLNTPKAISAAGNDGCRAILDEARTQHRQKTAEELVLLAKAVAQTLGKDGDDVDLQRLRDDAGNDAEKERDILKKSIKGMGKTGVDIFARRIQGVWPEWYPFADSRTLQSLEKLGLDGSAESLVKLLDDNWEELKTGNLSGKDEAKKRHAFVRILERAVGAELEGNIDEIRTASA